MSRPGRHQDCETGESQHRLSQKYFCLFLHFYIASQNIFWLILESRVGPFFCDAATMMIIGIRGEEISAAPLIDRSVKEMNPRPVSLINRSALDQINFRNHHHHQSTKKSQATFCCNITIINSLLTNSIRRLAYKIPVLCQKFSL